MVLKIDLWIYGLNNLQELMLIFICLDWEILKNLCPDHSCCKYFNLKNLDTDCSVTYWSSSLSNCLYKIAHAIPYNFWAGQYFPNVEGEYLHLNGKFIIRGNA